MGNAVAPSNRAQMLETVLLRGDLAKLAPEDRMSYYNEVCNSLGLNPLTKPFEYIQLNGKLTLYAKRDATDQLRKIHGVSIKITGREVIEGVYVVSVLAKDSSGREDEATGAVTIDGLKGDSRANAMLKAETKAKRRVTLSICGLGLLDETEVESVPNLSTSVPHHHVEQAPPQIAVAQANPPTSSPGDYVLKIGKYAGKRVREIPEHHFAGYLNWARDTIEKSGGEGKNALLKEFVENAMAFVDELDSQDGK